jgi:hypothetical protein
MKWLLLIVGFLALIVAIIVISGLLLPKQHTATRSLHLNQTPANVYALIAGSPTWRPKVHSYEPIGSIDGRPTWREIDQHNSGITYEEVEATPPTRRVTRIADKNLPYGGTWTYEIQPASNGSILRITEHGEVYNPIFRFVSRFIMGHTTTIDQYLKDVAAHYNEPANLQN